jgi:hypothetical protein
MSFRWARPNGHHRNLCSFVDAIRRATSGRSRILFSSLETPKICKRRFQNDPFNANVPESGKRNCSSQICRWSRGAKSECPPSESWATYRNAWQVRTLSTPSGRRAGTDHANCFQITYINGPQIQVPGKRDLIQHSSPWGLVFDHLQGLLSLSFLVTRSDFRVSTDSTLG